jgi:threonine aldolase
VLRWDEEDSEDEEDFELDNKTFFYYSTTMTTAMKSLIDLRSDTVTTPTEAMRYAMVRAPVGDDVYGEDPTTNRLQATVAELLGKEAGLFVPSGVMGNQLAIKAQTQAGDEVLVDSESHIFHYETAAPSIISAVQLHCVESDWGVMNEAQMAAVRERIRPSAYYYPRTSLLCLENTHNRYSGAVMPLASIEACAALAREHGLALHCDGARFWNACAASGMSPRAYAAGFDTLSVCLSKGLGAPVGSVLVGTRKMIDVARKWRKILGGGMRQTGILAAAGLHALEYHQSLLAADHANARLFADILAASSTDAVSVDVERVQTNIVVFSVAARRGLSAAAAADALVESCKQRGILLASIKPGVVRAVFHFQVSADEAEKAAKEVVACTRENLVFGE